MRSEDYSTYYAKTIDLKTNEVLYDKTDDVLKKLSEQCNKSFV